MGSSPNRRQLESETTGTRRPVAGAVTVSEEERCGTVPDADVDVWEKDVAGAGRRSGDGDVVGILLVADASGIHTYTHTHARDASAAAASRPKTQAQADTGQ